MVTAFGGFAVVRADQATFQVDGIAALIGGSRPGPLVDTIYTSDVELRARINTCGRDPDPLPLQPLPQELLKSTLETMIGEVLVEREALRLRTVKPGIAQINNESRRLERSCGGAKRLQMLLRALSVSQTEIMGIARRRALVAVFLSTNLAGTTIVSDSEVNRAYKRGKTHAKYRATEASQEVLRARLARAALDQTIARWVNVLRGRTPIYVFIQ